MEKLGSSGRRLVSVPSIVHGAPETAEVSALVVTCMCKQELLFVGSCESAQA